MIALPVRVKEALASADDGACVVVGPAEKIVLWNRAAERILGRPAREMIGRHCSDVLPDAGGRLCDGPPLTTHPESTVSFDLRAQKKDGHPVWLNVTTLPVRAGHDGPVVVSLFHDVTTTKELVGLVYRDLASPPARGRAAATLTPREMEVLRLLAEGASTKTAAGRLRVSEATLRNHAHSILRKLRVHSRLGAVAYAIRHRLL